MPGPSTLRPAGGRRQGLRALLPGALAALVLLVGLMLFHGPPAGAAPLTGAYSSEGRSVVQQDDGIDDQSPLTAPVVTAPTILPKPNSGEKPKFEGARGTWPQYLIFGLTMGGVALVFLLVARESKKKRQLIASRAAASEPQ